MEKKQTTRLVKNTANTEKLEIHFPDHMPSWMRYCDGGYAHFEATFHNAAEWLALTVVEGHDKARKETMVTLEPESARALYDFLHTRFGGK